MNIMQKVYDKDFRRNLLNNPKKYYKELEGILTDDIEIVVKENTKNHIYVVIPYNNPVSLKEINAAGGASTAATATTVSTISSFLSCLGSATSVACAGSAGSVKL